MDTFDNRSVSEEDVTSTIVSENAFEGWECIALSQEPTSIPFCMIPLFNHHANQNRMMWQVGFDGRSIQMYTSQSGAVSTNNVLANNVNVNGRYNETEIVAKGDKTIVEQALQECRHRFDLKMKQGYRPHIDLVDHSSKAMKGNTLYSDGKCKRLRYPVYVQPKLDGVRMLTTIRYTGTSEEVVFTTNCGNTYTHLTHLNRDLITLFRYLPPGSMIDGEIYNPDLTFNGLISIVKSIVNVKDVTQLYYYVFDVKYDDTTPYDVRYHTLHAAFTACSNYLTHSTLLVTNLANNIDEIHYYHDLFVSQGYEGVMIKKIANGDSTSKVLNECRYRGGRTSNILKYKEFVDEEGVIVAVTEAVGTESGCALFNVITPRGTMIEGLRMRGSHDQRREWFRIAPSLIGKKVTYKYQGLSEHGVPRFPVGLHMRDYE